MPLFGKLPYRLIANYRTSRQCFKPPAVFLRVLRALRGYLLLTYFGGIGSRAEPVLQDLIVVRLCHFEIQK